MPYSTPINDDENYWHILASYSGNPLILLLELLWTKLTYHFDFTIAGFSDSLTLEVLHPLLKAKAIEANGKIGWEYVNIIFKESALSSVSLFESWKPVEIDNLQFAIIQKLIEKEEISTSSDWFTTLIKHPNYSSATLSKLITSGLISKKGETLALLTIECKVVVMPDGSIVAGEDNSGRLTTWVENQIKEK
jgi:hypothetical protein